MDSPILSLVNPQPSPLRLNERGDIEVGGLRVLFDVIIDLHKQGESVDYITAGYPLLTLAEIYGALACYYQNQYAADDYLRCRDEDAKVLRRMIESTQPGIPEEMKARMEAFKAFKKKKLAAD